MFYKYRKALAIAVLVISIIVAYWPLRHNGYVSYDDGKYIYDNSHVKQGLSFETLKWAFTRPHFFMWHPLTTVSHLIEYEFFGANPLVSHLTNLLFHIINALLVWRILKEISGAFWASAFAAAVFALHPLQVESVAWAAERKNVISGLFWLLTIIAYLKYAKKPKAGSYIVLLLVYGLCILTKPTVVVVPFVLLLLDFWPLKRIARGTAGKLIIEKIPLFFLAGFLCVITILFQNSGDVIKTSQRFAFPYRLENAIISYLGYLFKMVYPINLAVFYPHTGRKIPLQQPLAALAVLAAITFIVFYFGRRRRYPVTGWLWYLGTLVPVIGLVQVGNQGMADRYMYMPMIGLLIIVAGAVPEVVQKWRRSRGGFVLAGGAILLILMILTRNQVRYWQNDFTLYGHAIGVTKNNEDMLYNLGAAYQKAGQSQQAMRCYESALRLEPGDLQALNNMGVLLVGRGRTDEAIRYFERAVELDANYVKALNNLGIALREKGRVDDALQKWQRALAIEPNQPDAHFHIGVTMFRSGKYDQAIEHFNKALEGQKDRLEAYNYIGSAYAAEGRFADALNSYNCVLKLRPDDANVQADTHLSIANLYNKQNDSASAVGHLREAIKQKGDNAEALNLLAWILATAKDSGIRKPDEAVNLAAAACKLSGYKNPGMLDTLAVAYAAAGKFDDAVKTEQSALKLAGKDTPGLENEINKRLELFKGGQAYYEK